MEVKINREIRNYTESMFFGLSLRQFIFSVLACGIAVGLYFLLKPYLGTETVSWVCILGAAPFAAIGFVKYNGMTAEKFVWAWFKSEFLMPKKLVFHSTNMEQQKKEMKEFLDDLTTRDQRMMFAVLTMVHTADTKEQLDNDTEALLTTARKHLCQFAVLKYQQMDGLNTVMPYGTRKIDSFRTLTTESLAVFMPFRVQDIYDENGIYYGQNVISKNMIIADRKQLLNGNSFILGVSGGGKSFAAKGEIRRCFSNGRYKILCAGMA